MGIGAGMISRGEVALILAVMGLESGLLPSAVLHVVDYRHHRYDNRYTSFVKSDIWETRLKNREINQAYQTVYYV